MHNSDWYATWGWFIWFGFIILMFSNLGNWGYTYRAHQKYDAYPNKDALDILNSRYAAGEIQQDEYNRIKSDIKRDDKKQAASDKKRDWSSQTSPA
jgi:putative membrane protein